MVSSAASKRRAGMTATAARITMYFVGSYALNGLGISPYYLKCQQTRTRWGFDVDHDHSYPYWIRNQTSVTSERRRTIFKRDLGEEEKKERERG